MINRTVWTIVVSLAAGIATIGGALAVIDKSPYRPAWRSEHLELAGRSYALELQIRQNELYAIAREIHSYQASNRPVPAHLLNRRNWLLNQIRILEKKLGL